MKNTCYGGYWTPLLSKFLKNAFSENMNWSSSVIRQKGGSQNGYFKKTKHAKFSEKRTFLNPWHVHVRVRIRGKKCLFVRKFDILCFLEIPVLRFALLLYYRRYVNQILRNNKMKVFWCFQGEDQKGTLARNDLKHSNRAFWHQCYNCFII